MKTVPINEETLQDIINIETGLLHPLTGFMGAEDFRSVVDRCKLADGQVFPISVTLDIPQNIYAALEAGEPLALEFEGRPVAELQTESTLVLTESDLQK